MLSALRVDVPLNDIHDIYENMILETPCKFTSSYSVHSVDRLMVLSALRVDVPLNDIHDIYENMILETPRKFTSSYTIVYILSTDWWCLVH